LEAGALTQDACPPVLAVVTLLGVIKRYGSGKLEHMITEILRHYMLAKSDVFSTDEEL